MPIPDDKSAPQTRVTERARARHVEAAAAVAAGLAALIGAVALFGWAESRPLLFQFGGDLPPMAQGTALAVITASLSVLLLIGRRVGGARCIASRVLAASTGALALAALLDYVTGQAIGVVSAIHSAVGNFSGERGAAPPALLSAASLVFLSASLLLVDSRRRRLHRASELLALVSAGIGVSALVGYVFGAAALYGHVEGLYPPTGVSLPASISLILLSSATLAVRPERGVTALLLAESPGARVARTFAGGAGAVFLVSAVSLAAERFGLYSRATALALPVIIALFYGGILVVRQARQLDVLYARIQQAEGELRRLFEGASDAILVAEGSGRYTDVNAEACRLLGYPKEELVGMSMFEIVPPEEIPRLRSVREGMLGGEEHRGEWRLRHHDGGYVPVDVSARILPDGRWQAILRDATARKAAEAAVAAERAWLRALVDQLPIGVLMMTPDGRRLIENRALLDFAGPPGRQDEFGSRVVIDFHRPNGEPLPTSEYPLFRVLRTGETTEDAELLVKLADGTMVPALIHSGPVRAKDGTLLGGVAILIDLRAQKELERLREEWASIIAHDLRQPVSTILTAAELIARGAEAPLAQTAAARIRTAGDNLARMIRDLLDVSRLDAHRFDLDLEVLEVGRALPPMLERVGPNLSGNPIRFTPAAAPLAVRADATRLEQVVTNLLTNAAKYGAAGRPIHVRVEARGEFAEIAVTNEGPGIPAADLARIFDRFRRTDGARRSGVEGLGLGLYICRRIVEEHGGSIRAESTPGETTTFRVALPLHREATLAAPSGPAGPGGSPVAHA